jgi:hypothetical protein
VGPSHRARTRVSGRQTLLEQVVFAAASGLQAAHRRGGGVPERELHAEFAADTLTGSYHDPTSSAAPIPFKLMTDWLVGTWLGGPVSPIVITPFAPWERGVPQAPAPDAVPSIYRARYLTTATVGPGPLSTWKLVSSVTQAGSQVDIRLEPGLYDTWLSGTINGSSLEGTVETLGAVPNVNVGDVWQAQRATDEVI